LAPMRTAMGQASPKKVQAFFSEEKNQKTFINCR
jgi:hypothetical protein